eukprot:scaffold8635_cov90-Skeletonema_dohrnii-CCMP3373.AAC.2
MGIIASRERKKEFDAAVKEVMRQRKAAQNLQNAIRQHKKDHNRPGLQRQPSGKLQLDTSSHRNKNALRRATVAHGSATDLENLQKLRAEFRCSTGGGNNNNSNNNAAKVRGEVAATKFRHRSSAGDITDSSSAQQGKGRADITERSPTLLGGRVVSNSRRNIFNASMSASDEVKKEVIQAMNKQEGGLSYDPISAKKKISSQPIISSSAQSPTTEPLVDNEPKKSSNGRNDSWTLSQDPPTTTDSNPFSTALYGIAGIRLEDLVPTRSPTSSNNNGNGSSLDDSGNSRGRHDGTVNQWKSKTLRMHPPQIDFELGNTSSSQEKTPSRDAKSSALESPPPSADDKDCPRKKFLLLSSSGGGSRSGGTGNTSRGSIFSSRGSLNEGNSNPAKGPSIAAIEEEGKPRHKGGEGDEQSLQSTSSKFSLKSLRSRASRRSRRLSQIRTSIRKSLTGKSDGVPLTITKLYDGDGAGSDIDMNSSHNSSHSQSVDPDKVRRHLLERRASNQSITSAYSNVTETSNSRNESAPAGWRYRLRKGGFRNRSMSALSVERDSRRSSNGSGWLDDASSSGSSFTEFYDNELHSGLMRSIITKSSSARSLGLSLPTVDEGEQNGEKQLNHVFEEQKEEEKADDIIASEVAIPNGKLDASEKSDDTAESFYRHPAHEHPLLHVRPNQLFPESPGWRCDLCMHDTLDLNEWAYVSTGLNWVSCERCFAQNGEVLAN